MIKFATLFFLAIITINQLSAQEKVVINELLTSNINGIVNPKYGEYYDWIELYNPSDSLIDLSEYFMTDDIENPTKWQFPLQTFIDSNSYLIIWADDKNLELHTNFKLSSDGEQLLLFTKDTVVVDSVSFGKQRDDISYGRDTSFVNWKYFGEPSPGFINATNGTANNKLSDPPKFSLESGLYSPGLTLELSSQKEGKIYYTIDATLPTQSSGILYESPINIDSTSIIRAIFIEDNLLPSKLISNSYFIGESSNLPVISLVTDPKNLWDDEIGINTIGTNGVLKWGVKANYWQEWERPVSIQFFEENKSLEFNMDAGLAINGARRNMLQKSFRILVRKKYGQEAINYKIFPNKEIRNYSSFVLRNGGYPEFRFTMIRDGFIQDLLSENMDIEYQAYRPSVLYLNGKYWGIFNIREKQNEDYLKENTGADPNNLDLLEYNMSVIEGDKYHYKHMIDFITSNDLSITENYDSVQQWMEIDNFINYQIAQIYIANIDWPANNIKYWRPKSENGKWRWLLFDLDGGFGLNTNYDFNSIEHATAENSTEWNNKPWSTFLLRNLLKNEEFKTLFIQKFAAHISYSFNPEVVLVKIDEYQEKLENEFPKHITRWATDCLPTNPESKDGCLYNDINEWYSYLAIMKEFGEKRPAYMLQNLKEYFEISDVIKFTVTTNIEDAGVVYVNGVKSNYNMGANLFADEQIIVEAIPNAGYRFVKWIGSAEGTKNKLEIVLADSAELSAVFEPINEHTIPSIITKNLFLSNENSPYSTNGDVYIYENSLLTIDKGVVINLPKGANIYVYGGLKINGIEDEPVQLRAQNSDEKWGALNFINTTNKSRLTHTIISETSNGKDKINQIGGISSFNSDLEINYLTMENVQFPIFIQYGNFILRNSKIQTDVTSDLVNVKYGSALIENCEFIGNYAVDTDAIDYDDVKSGIIRRNKIHDFNGDNSDAIDIGENAMNVLIEDNFIYNCSDKGVSVGQSSSTIIKGNIIINCNLGIGIKDDQSYAVVDHNTFYNNNIAVACYEKVVGRGGGKADVSNSIFSNSSINDVEADQYSEINIKYSLSDNKLLDGIGNILGSPGFINPEAFDFRISEESPAFDGGDPEYKFDPDGSRTNIGASYTNFYKNINIVISEINYHSIPNFNPKDWVEFYNPTDSSIDLSNWIFKDSEEEHSFLFPMGTIIEPKDFIVLCEDTKDFQALYPKVSNFIGDFDFGLNNSGELIRLYDNYGNIIDSLTYDDSDPWDSSADGLGYTLQLLDNELDNADALSWTSNLLYGSPGSKNILVGVSDTEAELPTEYSLSQNYPNPFNPITIINFSIPQKTNVVLKVFDVLGREVITLVDEKKEVGEYSIKFNAVNLSSGIYFYQLTANKYRETQKMILLK